MIGTLLFTLALQQAPVVNVSVHPSEAYVGDVVTLTILVEARGESPVRIVDPPLSGLEVQNTRDAARVVMDGEVPIRSVTRVLRLSATRAGTATVGPVLVHHGEVSAESAPITVTVIQAGRGTAGDLAPHIRQAIETLPPPTGRDVAVHAVAVPTEVTYGGQLDLLTVAWFPREIRTQLRQPPTVLPPEIEGAWSYRQVTPAGIVSSRRMGDRWYDVYVTHQIVFPLTAGRVRVGRATVSYTLPLSYSFLARELTHEVQSESLSVTVRPAPEANRPSGYTGAAGSGIDVHVGASRRDLPLGTAASVTVTLSGTGNVVLWPAPDIDWPAGLRVYPGEVAIETMVEGGLVGGTKRFSYLVTADDPGTHRIPIVRYAYFDPVRFAYRTATASGVELVTPVSRTALPSRAQPPPLMTEASLPVAKAVMRAVPATLWVVLALVPPAILLVLILLRRRRKVVARKSGALTHGRLERLDHELREAVGSLVAHEASRDGAALVEALRAAGVDTSLAQHAVRVRERVRYAVFGPDGGADPDELEEEVEEVLGALRGEAHREARRGVRMAAPLLLLVAVSQGQAQSAERLYEAQAFLQAADSFVGRASREPLLAAHWYNAGNAFYQAGEDGRARAAWLRARRLEPRRGDVRRALDLLPRDPVIEGATGTIPITPEEAMLVGLATWFLGWLVVGTGRRRLGVAVLAAALALGFLVAAELNRQRLPIAVVVGTAVPMREAPYGTAPGLRELHRGAGVLIENVQGPWMLVSRGDLKGWVMRGEVVRL